MTAKEAAGNKSETISNSIVLDHNTNLLTKSEMLCYIATHVEVIEKLSRLHGGTHYLALNLSLEYLAVSTSNK